MEKKILSLLLIGAMIAAFYFLVIKPMIEKTRANGFIGPMAPPNWNNIGTSNYPGYNITNNGTYGPNMPLGWNSNYDDNNGSYGRWDDLTDVPLPPWQKAIASKGL